jgi:hypothetical protein
MSNFDKLFSFGYPSYTKDPELYYNCIKNSHPRYRAEIFDIYFSDPYRYKFNGLDHIYGDVMGTPLPEAHIKSLLKIQKEFGIEVSLTFNETYPNKELVDDIPTLKGFVAHIGKYYEMGVRSCTISHVHMMATGLLQREFPEMRWKNTVNHIITTPQQVVDYHTLGYNVINLDRSLNRNMDMLKAMQPLRKKYPDLILSLLVTEGCMPSCPFKVEHDTMGGKNPDWSYWQHHGNMTCKVWRHSLHNEMPRAGTEMIWGDLDTFNEYRGMVDYFKFSGRNMSLPDNTYDQKFVWSNIAHIKGQKWQADNGNLNGAIESGTPVAVADYFEQVVTTNPGIISNFQPLRYCKANHPTTLDKVAEIDKETIWATGKGRALNHVLKNCKNECWDCHACERTFGAPDVDSLIEVNRDVSILQGHANHFKGIKISHE